LTRPTRIVDAAIVVFIVTTEAARGTIAAAHLFVANIVDARATVRGTALDTVAIFILYRSCSQHSLARTSLVSNACVVICRAAAGAAPCGVGHFTQKSPPCVAARAPKRAKRRANGVGKFTRIFYARSRSPRRARGDANRG
jgi:hypothetical protein